MTRSLNLLRAAPPDHEGAGPSLGRDSGRTIGGTIIATLCNFAVIAIIARMLGQGPVGIYSVAFAARALLVLLCALGMRTALTKFVASSRARDDQERLRGSIRLGVLLPTTAAVLIGALLALSAGWLSSELFSSPELEFAFVMVGLSLPFAVLMETCLAATRGFQSMRSYTRIALILEPASRLLLTAALLMGGFGLPGTLVALLTASGLSGIAAVLALNRTLGTARTDRPRSRPQLPWSDLLSFASVSWVASLATQGLLWADILLLGILVSDEEVGVYQVASRVVLAAMLMITPLTTAMGPRIAHHFELGDTATLSDRYVRIVLWTWRLTIPLLVGVVVVPNAALGAFGDGFDSGVVVIYVLAAGGAVEALAAPSAVLLNQIGRNKLNLIINVSALASNIVLNLILVPRIGILGAAIAWAFALVVPGVVRVVAVRRIATERWPVSRFHAVALVGALAGGCLVLALDSVLPTQWWARLLSAGLIVLVVYLVVMLKFGMEAHEHQHLHRAVSMTRRVVATRIPGLRKVRDRRRVRRMAAGSARLEIEQLISPFRYDILARAELFKLIAEHEDGRGDTDIRALTARAQQSAYRVWFDHVLVDVLDLRSASEAVRTRVFEDHVQRGVQLYRSMQRHGFDPRHPVTVAAAPAGTPVAGRDLGEDRWIAADGCHRLAVMYLSGKTHLETHEYVVDQNAERRYRTEQMARALRLDREEMMQFFAQGLVDPADRDGVRTWEDLLDKLTDPANREPLSRWPEAGWLSGGSDPGWYDVEEIPEAPPVVG